MRVSTLGRYWTESAYGPMFPHGFVTQVASEARCGAASRTYPNGQSGIEGIW